MHFPTSDFSRLIREMAEGDPNAFTQVYSHFNPILLDQLRIFLKKNPSLNSLVDPEDLAQDIWTDLAVGAIRLRPFPTPDHFLRSIAATTRYHILKAARPHLGIQNTTRSAATVTAGPAQAPWPALSPIPHLSRPGPLAPR